MHQYLFDACRAARLGEPAPPVPGTHDVAVLRGLRERRRFERVVAGRPAGGAPRPGRTRFRPGSRPGRFLFRLRLRLHLRLRTPPPRRPGAP